MWGHYGSKVMGVYSRPLSKVLGLTTNLLWWCRPFIYKGSYPICFSRRWVLVVSYLCSKFCIFNKPILEEYVSQIEGGPHLFQSCLHVVQDSFPPAVRNIHLSFESLAITNAPNLQTFVMDIHHNTSFESILEDYSISSISSAHIRFCSNEGAGLWLIAKPSIYSFHIAHFIFTSMLHFNINLI